jgi:polyketide-type polyunsaturated fatty acid synthase PfaA
MLNRDLHNKKSSPVAIVGMSSLFPEARTVGDFWNNILSRKDCIREIIDGDPKEFDGFWRLDEYYSDDPMAIDKTYGKTGGFIPEIEFDPIEFGIPPINLESIGTTQLFAMVVAKQALADAGYSREATSILNRERTGVVLGVGGCGNIAFTLGTRTNFPQWERVISNLGFPDEMVQLITTKLKHLYAGWRESSFPGLLGNVVSGRVASFFDLGGTNCTLDAACASSLVAVKMAIAELADGSCDAVLTGGVNVDNSILAYMCFSKTPALSKVGASRPFDATSDGIVLGDGVGMLVLKRLEDAEADGNKIYGVIRGIGSSSDGRAKSIYAPRTEGQIQALNRAYARSDVSPQQIQLVEAHGTGTIAGDLCEIKSISSVYQANQVPAASVALGSVKSQIGHTRIAAGAASLIKVTLGLYHKILPPTINVTKPHPQLALDNSCFYINDRARPWIQPVDGSKRRAAVSSFGFGGTNFHLIVEEYEAEHQSAYRLHSLPEIFIVQAANLEALSETCQKLLASFRAVDGQNHYHQYCNSHRNLSIPDDVARLGFVTESLEQTIQYLEQSINLLAGDAPKIGQHPKGIYYRDRGLNMTGKVVALFPGQGSQFINMGRDLANNYPEIRTVLAEMDRICFSQNRPRLSNSIYPPTVFSPEQLQQQKVELTKTENTQPAIGAISAGMYKLLEKSGFKPDFVLGHSFGELTALWAAGGLSDRSFYQLAIDRGNAMQLSTSEGSEAGAMLAVNANEQVLQSLMAKFDDVTITNYNSNHQTVLGGSKQSIMDLQQKFSHAGIKATLLPVANAFHTQFVKSAAEPLAKKIFQTSFNPPSIPIYSNVTAQPYSQEPEEIKKLLATHLLNPVAFKQSIEAIYERGGRVFLEIGPKNVLTSFVKEILEDKEHLTIAINLKSEKGEEYEFRRAILQLLIAGMELQTFDPYALAKPVAEAKSKPSLSIVLNGGFYLNPDTKQLRQQALVEKDTALWDTFVNSSMANSNLPVEHSTPLDSLEFNPISMQVLR